MRPRASVTGLASAAIAVATAVLYVVIIAQQGNRDPGGVRLELGSLVWATILFALPAAISAGAVLPPSSRGRWLLGGGATGLAIVGVLALFSIGMPLLVASALAWAALATRRPAR